MPSLNPGLDYEVVTIPTSEGMKLWRQIGSTGSPTMVSESV